MTGVSSGDPGTPGGPVDNGRSAADGGRKATYDIPTHGYPAEGVAPVPAADPAAGSRSAGPTTAPTIDAAALAAETEAARKRSSVRTA